MRGTRASKEEQETLIHSDSKRKEKKENEVRSSVMTMLILLILNWNLVSKNAGKEYNIVSLAGENNIR